MDPTESYVPVVAIRNAFQLAVHEMDRFIWPREGRSPGRAEVIAFIESLQYTIFKHSRRFLRQPTVKQPAAPPSDIPTDSRAEYQAWRGGRS